MTWVSWLSALFGLLCAGWAYWNRPRPRPTDEIRAGHRDEDLLGPEFMAEDELLAEFHGAGIYLEGERQQGNWTHVIGVDWGVGEAMSQSGGLADRARQQGYLAFAHAQAQDSQLLANMAQERALQTLAQTNPHRANALAQLIGGPLGGIGSALGGLGGLFGQGLGSVARWGDK